MGLKPPNEGTRERRTPLSHGEYQERKLLFFLGAVFTAAGSLAVYLMSMRWRFASLLTSLIVLILFVCLPKLIVWSGEKERAEGDQGNDLPTKPTQ